MTRPICEACLWRRFALLLLISLGIIGSFDFADELQRGAEEKVALPARVMYSPELPSYWKLLQPSGIPATFEDCSWARLTINHDPCYSNKACALKRICYGQLWTAL